MSNIVIIGSGSWGTALAIVLSRNKNTVFLWSKRKEHRKAMQFDRENKEYLPGIKFPNNIFILNKPTIYFAEYIILAVPSFAFHLSLKFFSKNWKKHQKLIWVTKGFFKNGYFFSNIVNKILGKKIFKAILAGPSFATEVAKGLPTIVTAAGDTKHFSLQIKNLFQSKNFKVNISKDFIGIQFSSAMKNILAIIIGIIDGIGGYGMNAKSSIITYGLAEISKLGCALGVKQDTIYGISGLGDLILTCLDNQSRNRRFGILLGKGYSIKNAFKNIGGLVEGFYVVKITYNLSIKNRIYMPIIHEIYQILYQKGSAKKSIKYILKIIGK